MIKEKKKTTKYNSEKSKNQIIAEYMRTVFCSVLFALVLTSCLAVKSRSDMIKNLYADANAKKEMDKNIAKQIIAQTNLIKDLENKNYAICMHVGDLYEAAGDYPNAQIAYENALSKAKPEVYKPYYKLIEVLTAQEKFEEAEFILDSIKDYTNKDLIKLKTRCNIIIGDKYYSIGKFLSAAKSYEAANSYYNKFVKKDKTVSNSIKTRIVNSYINTADIMVKSGLNSEAVKFLKKAQKYEPNSFIIKYKLAIILADSDPEKSVAYFEELLDKMPQDIDYSIYDTALMKAANIADLDNRPTKAKYYRYRIHSVDMFINRKVVYKNDIDIELKSFNVNKILLTYPLKASYTFKNNSNIDIINLYGDIVLDYNGKPVETLHVTVADRDNPLFVSDDTPNNVSVKFKRKIFAKKELDDYTIKIYLYKDEKYKTLVYEMPLPQKTIVPAK